MLTMDRKPHSITRADWDDLPSVRYPDWKIAQLEADYREAMEDLRAGRIVPMTVDEMAAQLGIDLDDEDD